MDIAGDSIYYLMVQFH